MNGRPPPPANAVPAAPGPAPVAKRRRPRPAASVLRAPQRPLKSVSRPVTTLTQLNKRDAPNTPVSIERLRNEFIDAGASSYPLVVTRKDLKELRHHVMRLQAKDRVNIQNEQQFTPPVRLHRRDQRAPPGGKGAEDEDKDEDIEEARERERQEEEKEARRVKREGIQAQIAPTGTTKGKPFGKKTEQKYRPDDTPEAKKRQLLRYEETLPWHLEDDDNKQTWVGLYESEMSEKHVMLTVENGPDQLPVIQLAPLERWYRFNAKTKAKSTEDSDLLKAKKDSYFEARERKKFKEEMEKDKVSRARQIRTRVGGGDDDEGRIKRLDDDDVPRVKREADADDIDFEEDFADDEEGLNGLFDGDDEIVKEAQEKLKRDQLSAAAFDLRDERQIWAQEEREKKEEEEKALEAEIRKSLVKREKNYDYAGSDSEYSETDSETERQRAKEEEEKKAAEQIGKASEGDKTVSGASTKGGSTPAPRSTDVNKKKRPAPGSPNLSEASGNESARKKHKKKHEKNADGSRKAIPLRTGAASGSDSEMTDASKPKKHKLKVRLGGTPGASPSVSRAGSPAAQVNGSRAGSPVAAGGAPVTPRTFTLSILNLTVNNLLISYLTESRLPSASEIYNALPPEGMPIQTLINKFRERVDKSNMNVFIKLVRAVASYDKGRGWLSPLPELPSDEQIAAHTKPKPAVKAASPPA
ncbi:transcription factor IIF subunit tfg1 [Paraconiothyrium brasiliense]|uniref:Transcription factor IIF subunit tfg1 n=1 Tax=Paraconiothyrium brasiliense TaxID=300254 RepID=A0ABR3S053_9PLEO